MSAQMIIERYRYVHEDIDRHGNTRIYFWRGKGRRKIRIREAPGTPEFRRAYDAALSQLTAQIRRLDAVQLRPPPEGTSVTTPAAVADSFSNNPPPLRSRQVLRTGFRTFLLIV